MALFENYPFDLDRQCLMVEESMATIQAKDLRKRFGTIHAVDGEPQRLCRGSARFLGPNSRKKHDAHADRFLEADSGSVQLAGIALDVDPLGARRRWATCPKTPAIRI